MSEELGTYMRKLLAIVSVVVMVLSLGTVLTIAPAAAATTVTWQGITWSQPYGNVSVNSDGNLAVNPSSCSTKCFGAAHFNTSPDFRSASGQSVTFTFVDQGPGTVAPELWFEDESGPNAAWSEFGAFPEFSDYTIYWWDEVANVDGFVHTLIPRSAGTHTFTIGKRSDNTVDYYIDGSLVYTSADIHPDYIGDVYLAAESSVSTDQTAVFTDFRVSTDYTGPVPPPTDMNQCKNGDWQQYDNPAFTNQGKCVSYVQANAHASKQ